MSAWENYHLEWSPDPLSVTVPSWQDIAAYALAPSGPPIFSQTGTPPMGTAGQYATMSVDLDNTDGRFTFGNTTSPLSPNWKPGRRLRLYEAIGGRRFDLFAGYMLAPENPDFADRGVDQVVALNAVDRLGWINGGRRFVSTLAEHIRYNSAATLIAYWPLGETVGPYRPLIGAATWPPLVQSDAVLSGGSSALDLFAPAGSSPLPGDDLRLPRFAPQFSGAAPAIALADTKLQAFINPNVAAATNSTITVAVWVWPDAAAPDAAWEPVRIYFGWNSGTGLLRIRRTDSTETPGQVWKGSFRDDSLSFIAEAFGPTPTAIPTLLACHINLAANTLALYVNGVQYAGAVTGTMPTSFTFVQIAVGSTYMGALGHVQVHQSSGTADHDLSAHTAQYVAGLSGLAGQFAGDRVRTLAQYAGVPPTELSLIQQGTAVMQKATLAGLSPYAAMQTAETTERGRLRTNGAGLIVFDPRTRRYNS